MNQNEGEAGCIDAQHLRRMKRFFAISIALSTLGALPVAAETAPQSIPREDQASIWLVLVIGNGVEDGSLTTLPMKTMDQCEEQGANWISSNRAIDKEYIRGSLGFECLEGR